MSARERLAHAPAQLLVLAPADRLIAIPQRRRLRLRSIRAGRQDALWLALALAVREVEDAPCEELDLALALAALGVLVRVRLRVVRVRGAADRGDGAACARRGELPDVRDEQGGCADVADQLRIWRKSAMSI